MVVDAEVLGRLTDLDLGDTNLDVVCNDFHGSASRLGTTANVTMHRTGEPGGVFLRMSSRIGPTSLV